MLIVCPSCATSYDVKLASLGPEGRQVRCARCQTVWHAAPSRADSLVAAAAALAPERPPPLDGAPPRAAAASRQQAQALKAEAGPDVDEAAEVTLAPEPGEGGSGPDGSGERAGTQAVAGAWFEPPASLPPSGETWREPPDNVLANEHGETIAAEDGAEVEAPPIAPVDLDEGRPPLEIDDTAEQPAAPVADVETVAARRRRRSRSRRPAWPLSAFQSAILGLVVVDAVLIGWRADVVRALPQTASFYAMVGMPVNLRGLDLDDVKTTTEQHEGVQILVVEGNIVNDSRKLADVPRIKFILRNAARQEIYSWTAVPSTGMLPPGQAVAFRSRLASPPPDGRDVVVRFVTRRDLMAASH